MLEWFCLRTHFAQEQRAARELTNQRIRNFLPLVRTEHRRPDGLLVAKIKPLFTGYLFTQLHWEKHGPILSTRGVKSFVGYTEGMAKAPTVSKEDIKELKSRLEEVLGLDVIISRPKVIEPDMMVSILFGPFRDHVAKVHSLHGSRVEVILSLFGIETKTKLPKEALLAA